MARTRAELDRILRTTLGTTNVYFDPPESFKLKYPCIVYSLGAHVERFSENEVYNRLKRYTLTYITRDADDPMVEILEDMEYCHLNRPFTADGLFHYAYDIYF